MVPPGRKREPAVFTWSRLGGRESRRSCLSVGLARVAPANSVLWVSRVREGRPGSSYCCRQKLLRRGTPRFGRGDGGGKLPPSRCCTLLLARLPGLRACAGSRLRTGMRRGAECEPARKGGVYRGGAFHLGPVPLCRWRDAVSRWGGRTQARPPVEAPPPRRGDRCRAPGCCGAGSGGRADHRPSRVASSRFFEQGVARCVAGPDS